MPKLKDAIVHLGKRLNASESIVVFPLSELIEDLERLMMHLEFDLDCPVDKRWIVECFEGIEIPYRVLIENYVSLIQRPDCPAIGNMAYSVAELVFDWIHASKRYFEFLKHF
jgi:hypothetical protein